LLAHLLNAAIRSLAVTAVLGSILIYATGGFDAPNLRAMSGIIAICFFMFWVTFFFVFGPRVPKHDGGGDEGDVDNVSHLAPRGRRRRESDDESEMNEIEAGSD
jgi:hypothetical protein